MNLTISRSPPSSRVVLASSRAPLFPLSFFFLTQSFACVRRRKPRDCHTFFFHRHLYFITQSPILEHQHRAITESLVSFLVSFSQVLVSLPATRTHAEHYSYNSRKTYVSQKTGNCLTMSSTSGGRCSLIQSSETYQRRWISLLPNCTISILRFAVSRLRIRCPLHSLSPGYLSGEMWHIPPRPDNHGRSARSVVNPARSFRVIHDRVPSDTWRICPWNVFLLTSRRAARGLMTARLIRSTTSRASRCRCHFHRLYTRPLPYSGSSIKSEPEFTIRREKERKRHQFAVEKRADKQLAKQTEKLTSSPNKRKN